MYKVHVRLYTATGKLILNINRRKLPYKCTTNELLPNKPRKTAIENLPTKISTYINSTEVFHKPARVVTPLGNAKARFKMADDFTLFTLRNSRSGWKKPYRSEIVARRLRVRLLLPIKEVNFGLVQYRRVTSERETVKKRAPQNELEDPQLIGQKKLQ